MIKLLPALWLSLAFISGCGSASLASTARPLAKSQAKAQVKPAAVQQLKVTEVGGHLAEHPEAVFIDVREVDEYTGGHAPGTKLYPLSKLAEWAPKLDKKAHYVVICRSGSRSMKVCNALEGQGFADLTNVQGGMLEWEQVGTLPVVVGPEPGTWPR
jgi:rhodanese-related sulfurtransferase